MAEAGHNGVNSVDLKSFVERIERLEEEKKALSADINEIYTQAKDSGFDKKTLREVIKLRRLTFEQRKERDAMIELYMDALGMFVNTPLGQAAIDRARA